MEKKIISEFGLDKGQLIILQIKTSVLEYEKEIGVSFFANQVQALGDLIRVKTLFPIANFVEVTPKSNLESVSFSVANKDGEVFNVAKTAQINFNGKVYFELEFLDDIRVRKINFYLIEKVQSVLKLTLVEDEKLDKLLDREWEMLNSKA